MLNFLLRNVARFLLWLRYRVVTHGLEEVARRGTRGILFLPNHPALIDPIILMTVLNKRFAARAVADQDQVDRPVVRWAARQVGVLPFPSLARHGPGARAEVERAIARVVECVGRGDSFVFYPAGHVYRTWLEDLRGNSGVETILRQAPDVRIVLVRTSGLWGSAFSWAKGRPPSVAQALKQGAIGLLLSAIFFAPRRRVAIEFHEADDVPATAGRDELNRYLEAFYNEQAHHNTYVPYSIWERGGAVELPEAERPRMAGDARAVPQATREIVASHLRELTGKERIADDEHLARDLGLDSLARTELLAWLEEEFGFPQGDADALQTVGDVLLAACGEAVASEFVSLRRVSPKWLADARDNAPLPPLEDDTVTAAFLRLAGRSPGKVIVADQIRGEKTYRDLVLAVLLLKPAIEKCAGERVGIMLPASVAADAVYLATLFAGKTPVMINWTVGRRNLGHCLELAGVRHILTAEALLRRLEAQGNSLADFRDRFVLLEEVTRSLPLLTKLAAVVRSHVSWASLRDVRPPETAVILFTSGSETLPKAVPLSHRNMLENLRRVLELVTLRENDRMIGFLPPFHAFGITVTVLGPLCVGFRTIYHPDPTDGAVLGRLIEAYRATILLGTPTFLSGILRASTREQLASLRLAVTGAEKCPERVYDTLAERCPGAKVLEGYGVTECSPIVAVNTEADPRRGTIGRLLPGFKRLLLHAETGRRVEPPGTGILHVRGPCVFAGYLGYEGAPPFVEIDGEPWYCTGDIVSEDADGVLTFQGRVKRFIKLGGEMISLPAIEAVLLDRYASDEDKGPVVAVEATQDESHPEAVLFTTRDLDRETANRQLREAGLSPLHNIRRVVRVDEIPVLGTGKTDYRALKARLAAEAR